ncbi:unnamed protein product [Parascedosporium putredinis]|uniref:Holocytochrome c-type synthase n=1 Tax=Parascedosporium putredinis TaxID=1442378 RepID=A0A9P1H0I7_9PEZI|nr:unnamed protein product [Parascedosporium putredinis]CAI7992177.1 unnamed protein product [Parascedosporium putredinis]
MGWFWADTPAAPAAANTPPASGCPVPHAARAAAAPHPTVQDGQTPPPRGVVHPRSDANENWEYPSPQQMYNALLRKGYQDTDITAVEEMVAVHNFLNEGAWAEVVGWEQRFAHGLVKGWQTCKRGEENGPEQIAKIKEAYETEPTLIRFQGRPKEMTPKAAFWQLLGRVYPSKTEPPFDRHDWYVARNVNGQPKEVRYVIDYYTGPPEPTGEPVFYLDVRPALTPTGAAERLIRWSSDVWWRASGGAVREATAQGKA